MKLDTTGQVALSHLTAGGALAALLVLAAVPAIPHLLPTAAMSTPAEPVTEKPVAQIVALMIAAQLRQAIEDVTPGARLVSDLSADELDILEIAMALEGEFSITVEDEDEPALATVQGCVDLVNRKLVLASAPKRHGVPA